MLAVLVALSTGCSAFVSLNSTPTPMTITDINMPQQPTPIPTLRPTPEPVVYADPSGDCIDTLTGETVTCQGGDVVEVSVDVKSIDMLDVTIIFAGSLDDLPPDQTMSISFEFQRSTRTATLELTPPACGFTVPEVGICSYEGNTLRTTVNLSAMPGCPHCEIVSGIRLGVIYPWADTPDSLIIDHIPERPDYIQLLIQ
jgi:hypothetical protein